MASSSSRDAPHPSSKPRSCLCSPTNHPGSFQCSFHKNRRPTAGVARVFSKPNHMQDSMRMMKAILREMIKPSSSHDIQRRKNFEARPSRFCLMNSPSTPAAAPPPPLAVS